MVSSQPVTETVILHLRPGIRLDVPLSESDAGANSPELQLFARLTNTFKSQQGFVRQRWGHQVENPTIFVWCFDWKTVEDHDRFMASEVYKPFRSGVSQLFDLNVAPPLMIFTGWTSDTDAAFNAPVTEVSFFTMTKAADEQAKTTVQHALEPILRDVKAVGKACGSAIGWMLEVTPHNPATPLLGRECLHGIFGYESIDDHMKWREQPEHGNAHKIFEDLEKDNILFEPASVPGLDPNTGYFHVKFTSGDVHF